MTCCCYKLLENPTISHVKSKPSRDAIIHLLGVLIKKYNHLLGPLTHTQTGRVLGSTHDTRVPVCSRGSGGFAWSRLWTPPGVLCCDTLGHICVLCPHPTGASVKVIQLLQHFEQLGSVCAQAVSVWSTEYGVKAVVGEVIRSVRGGQGEALNPAESG